MLTKMQSDKIAQNFSDAARYYDQEALIQREIAEQLFLYSRNYFKDQESILDLGAGTGFLAEAILKDYPTIHYFALDLSHKMLNIFKNKQLSGHSIQADMRFLPVREKSMPVVISSMAMQWLNNYSLFFEQLKKILQKQGFLIFSVLIDPSFKEIHYVQEKYPNCIQLNVLPKKEELLTLLEQNNFKILLERQKTHIYYHETPLKVLEHFRQIGANYIYNKRKSLTGANKFQLFLTEYEKQALTLGVPLSYEVLYIIAQSR